MNQSTAISLVIPIYNVEKYLAECLTSCINQTLTNIEIICVNDCSPDNSRSIAEDFARRDSRIKIIDHEQNKGLGAARNTGIEHAQGEYVWFVDSDDVIAENACQLLYDTATQYQVDILCFDVVNFKNDPLYSAKRIYQEPLWFNDWPHNVTIQMQEAATKLKGVFAVSPWLYITKREYLKQFKFRENGFWEDTEFTPILFASCNTLRYIPFTAYYYRLSPNSIMRTPLSEKKLLDFVAAGDALNAFIKEKHLSNKHFLTRFYTTYIKGVYQDLEKNKDIVENSPECKEALVRIAPIVRRIKRKEFFHDLLTLPPRDKLFIIYWHLKDFFIRHFTNKSFSN
ncbi:MAG: glycosyltransferase [Treponemataceae bacterium]|nr:glycosyltransferase [Treponemataceae bacterium]